LSSGSTGQPTEANKYGMIHFGSMDPTALAGLVKRLYPEFDLNSFENRLKLQKFVFLLRSAGLDLGYNYSLYLRGPYSPEVARDAFSIQNWQSIRPVRFGTSEYETKFDELLEFLDPHKNDIIWLEIVSTILLISELHKNESKEAVIDHFLIVKPKFGKEEIIPIYEELVSRGMIA